MLNDTHALAIIAAILTAGGRSVKESVLIAERILDLSLETSNRRYLSEMTGSMKDEDPR